MKHTWMFVLLLAMQATFAGCGIDQTGEAPKQGTGNLASASPQASRGQGKDSEALQYAAIKGDIITLKALLDEGADTNAADEAGDTIMMKAVPEGHINVLQLALSRGANVNAKNKEGRTVLTNAAASGNIDIVQFLLANGADINATDRYGYN